MLHEVKNDDLGEKNEIFSNIMVALSVLIDLVVLGYGELEFRGEKSRGHFLHRSPILSKMAKSIPCPIKMAQYAKRHNYRKKYQISIYLPQANVTETCSFLKTLKT